MKRVLAISLLCALSACASSGNKDSAKLSQNKQYTSGFDENYMARVEKQAAQRGVVVKWIHPPRAPKAKKDG
jgi:hypothetical protein